MRIGLIGKTVFPGYPEIQCRSVVFVGHPHSVDQIIPLGQIPVEDAVRVSKHCNKANDVSARRNSENQLLQGSALNHADIRFDPVKSDMWRVNVVTGSWLIVSGY